MQGLTEEGKFERVHISGHISGKELEEFISKIKPDCVIPIHTEHPEEFKKFHKNVKITKRGETIEI
jgi:ribonuclease J